jgi:hypothetical protein
MRPRRSAGAQTAAGREQDHDGIQPDSSDTAVADDKMAPIDDM